MKRTSFDFDGTLTKTSVKNYAIKLLAEGIQVWIVTSRMEDSYLKNRDNSDLRKMTKELGIPDEHVIYMNMADKYEFFLDKPDFIFHLDDDWIENGLILEHTRVPAVSSFGNPNWIEQCQDYIDKIRSF